MKMGVREFRERISEVVDGVETVEVTKNGRKVGTYTPERRPRDPAIARAALQSIERWQAEMKAKGVDLEAELSAMGLSPWGEPLDDHAGR